MMSRFDDESTATAYHEAGHALVCYLASGTAPSIWLRDGAGACYTKSALATLHGAHLAVASALIDVAGQMGELLGVGTNARTQAQAKQHAADDAQNFRCAIDCLKLLGSPWGRGDRQALQELFGLVALELLRKHSKLLDYLALKVLEERHMYGARVVELISACGELGWGVAPVLAGEDWESRFMGLAKEGLARLDDADAAERTYGLAAAHQRLLTRARG